MNRSWAIAGCVSCIEYIKGNLTTDEFLRNKKEYSSEEHSEEALRIAEFAEEMEMGSAKVNIIKD